MQNSDLLKVFLLLILQSLSLSGYGQEDKYEIKIDSLLSIMTLEEKIGQLNQYSDDWRATGPIHIDNSKVEQIKAGEVGSILNSVGAARIRSWQEFAVQSRLGIPLLFGIDVLHGYKTTFPIPLAEACSWDIDAMYLSARIAATEASAAGINWTFAPMVDISRDPRWGRVMEGAGEDPYLGSVIAEARVRGFQGDKLSDLNSVMACAKHYAAYGAPLGGRDYSSVDISPRMLWEVYLPPFRAAADAGVATFMNSFSDINGVPATGSRYLQRDILKRDWNFKGFVVSDWGSIGEMVVHGFASDEYEAALKAISAGCDMDMESRCYRNNLFQLVQDQKVPESVIDDAVRRILRKKFESGLFDDPFRYCDIERERETLINPEHKVAARNIAARSIVLLKNEGLRQSDRPILPLSKDIGTIAFIGPMVKLLRDNKGPWDVNVPGFDSTLVVSQWEGVKNKVSPRTKMLYARGCNAEGNDKSGFAEAVDIALQSDVIILSIGERREMSGEAKSRSEIGIPGVQEDLLKELLSTGKPVVVLINAGRPLVFNYTSDNATAILYTWWLGNEAGNAIADVLFGDYNPSGKLVMSFPRSVGQIPVYYSHFNTGRPPVTDRSLRYRTSYIDLSVYPKYEFGYGLSYTSFIYSDLYLSRESMEEKDSIIVSFRLTNSGEYDGEEVVQLYLRDRVGSVVRPVKELKDFSKVYLKKGESKVIRFVIGSEKLAFYNQELEWITEPGLFDIMIGSSSDDIRLSDSFELIRSPD